MSRPLGSPNKRPRKDSVRLTLNLDRALIEIADAHMVRSSFKSRTAAIESLIQIGGFAVTAQKVKR